MIANVNIEGRISRSGYIIFAFGLVGVLVAPAGARIDNRHGTSARQAGDMNPAPSTRGLTDSSGIAVDVRDIHRGESPRPTLRHENALDRRDLPVREESLHDFQIAPNTVVDVSYILGSVEVEATDSDNAEVYLVRSAQAQADLDRLEGIIIEQSPTGLVLRGEDSKSKGIEIRHHVHLRVPRTSQLSLREINGRVTINGLEGAIRLNEVNGDAQLSQVAGELEMISVNGSVSLGIVRIAPEGIRLRDIGAVDVSVAAGINAQLELEKLQDQPLIEMPRVSLNRVGKSTFVGRIGAGGPVIRIFDVRGHVRIHND